MHAQTQSVAQPNDVPVDAWAVLTGGSFAIVAGLFVDLLRLAVHQLRQALGAHDGRGPVQTRDWQRPGPCGACSR